MSKFVSVKNKNTGISCVNKKDMEVYTHPGVTDEKPVAQYGLTDNEF